MFLDLLLSLSRVFQLTLIESYDHSKWRAQGLGLVGGVVFSRKKMLIFLLNQSI